MRPHKLIINAFGPFADTQQIDFSGDDFILITGATGSGKTSIFDAIMFVLYGVLPGTRDSKTAVSNFRKPDDIPYVEMSFSIRMGMYKVLRVPPYVRPAKRGENRLVEEQGKVILSNLKNEVWEILPGNPTEINDRIQGLLYLRAEEFSKIVLLPQGEFQNFLVADTAEKISLFKKLFPVHEHEMISEAVKETANNKKNEIQSALAAQKKLSELFNPETCDSHHEALNEHLKNLEKAMIEAREDSEKAIQEFTRAEALDGFFREYETIQNDLSLHRIKEKEIITIKTKIGYARQAQILKPFYDNVQHVTKEYDEKTIRFEKMKAFLEEQTALLRKSEIDVVRIPVLEKENVENHKLLGKLNHLLPRLQALQVNVRQLNMITENYQNLLQKNKSLKQYIDEINIKIETEKKLISLIDHEISGSDAIMKRLYNLYQVKNDLDVSAKFEAEIIEYDATLKVFHESIETLEKSLIADEILEREIIAKHEAFASARMAESLIEGSPCPVCGSLEHPHPARITGDSTIDEEELKKIQNDLKNKWNEITRMKTGLLHIEELKIKNLKEIEKLECDGSVSSEEILKEISNLEKSVNDIQSKKNLLISGKKKLENIENQLVLEKKGFEVQVNEISRLEVEMKTSQNEKALLESELKDYPDIPATIHTITHMIKANEITIKSIQDTSNNARENVKGTTEAIKEIEANISEISKKCNEFTNKLNLKMKETDFKKIQDIDTFFVNPDELSVMENTISEYYTMISQLESQITSMKNRIGNSKRPDMKFLQNNKIERSKKYETIEIEKNEIVMKIKDLLKQKNEFDELREKIKILSSESETCIRLSNDLNGKNLKNINFQTFILTAYLKEVIRHADKRFNIMSDGRYSLYVNDEISHGNKQAGLDLDVFDAHSGQRRNVRSLSGGEKFLASISLALGLSDVIQSRAGDIELDAIFIDEGFGSLDDASLDRALTILDEIRGNRLVGIISHVTELKTRIPRQIEVIKGKNGSWIKHMC
jgi:exonuclease SbcC